MRHLYILGMITVLGFASHVHGAEPYLNARDVAVKTNPVAHMLPVSPDDRDYGKSFWVVCDVADTGRLQTCQADEAGIENKAYVASVIREFEDCVISTTDKQGQKTAGRQIRFLMKVGSGEPRSL